MKKPAPLHRAIAVWSLAMIGYIIAIAGRTSFGVVGLIAVDRFQVNATLLSLFVVIQVGVYAGAQIPAGLLLDRYGPRAMIVAGGLVMVSGQALMATTSSLTVALIARVLIGAGDAATFISVVRIIPSWFASKLAPLVTQLTGIVGQLGQVISAGPFLMLLRYRGWEAAFLLLAGTGLAACALVYALVRDEPGPGKKPVAAAERTGAAEALRYAIKHPATWVGYFVYQLGGTVMITFLLMWGVPYMRAAAHLTDPQVSAVIVANTAAGVVFGPLIAHLISTYPGKRTWFSLAIAAVTGGLWVAIILPSTAAPYPLLLVFSVVMAASGAAGSIGFDYSRTEIPRRYMGTATGITNMGGFTGALIVILAVGLVLDGLRPEGNYDHGAFRVAFALIILQMLLSTAGVIVARSRLKKIQLETGGVKSKLQKQVKEALE